MQLNFYWTINSQKILIIDLDVHQGNGTAEIFAKTLMCLPFQHMVELTTHLKETSDLDIAFDDNTSDDEFLKIISAVIPKLIEAQNPISSFI
jgi:acetoin utilization deacetylase AcuC-like enzyme